jgi:hypothetical protein
LSVSQDSNDVLLAVGEAGSAVGSVDMSVEHKEKKEGGRELFESSDPVW